jgi:hypothetical protein
MVRLRQQFAIVDGACGSKNKMARISPICKKCKIFISALKSPTYRDFMKKKSLKSKRSKSHTWAPLIYASNSNTKLHIPLAGIFKNTEILWIGFE